MTDSQNRLVLSALEADVLVIANRPRRPAIATESSEVEAAALYWDIHTAKRCHAVLGAITDAWSTREANNPIAKPIVRNLTRFSVR